MDDIANTKKNFYQIQNIMEKIGNDKILTEKFKSFSSLEERFKFTKEIYNKFQINPLYSLEEFNKFEIFILIMYEISLDNKLSEEFKKIDNLEKISEFLGTLIKNKNPSIEISKEDIEAFLYSAVVSSDKNKIPTDVLGSVSGGKGFSVDTGLGLYQQMGLFHSVGIDLGQKIGSIIYKTK